MKLSLMSVNVSHKHSRLCCSLYAGVQCHNNVMSASQHSIGSVVVSEADMTSVMELRACMEAGAQPSG